MTEQEAYIDLFIIALIICTLPMVWLVFTAIGKRIAEVIMSDPVKDSLMCRIKGLEDTIKEQDDNAAYLRERLLMQSKRYQRIMSKSCKDKK